MIMAIVVAEVGLIITRGCQAATIQLGQRNKRIGLPRMLYADGPSFTVGLRSQRTNLARVDQRMFHSPCPKRGGRAIRRETLSDSVQRDRHAVAPKADLSIGHLDLPPIDKCGGLPKFIFVWQFPLLFAFRIESPKRLYRDVKRSISSPR